jgi:hypothetical protein
VRRGLGHQLVEGSVGSLPVGGLDAEEGGNGHCHGESKKPSMVGRFDDGSHKWEGQAPTD